MTRSIGFGSLIALCATSGSIYYNWATPALTSGWHSDRVPEACSAAQKVAFISYRNGNGDIYVMDFDGANQIALTSDPSIDGYPRFSPDCQQVVFFSNRTGTYQIYSKAIDNTSPLQQLTFGLGDKFDPVISSDGAYLSFTSNIDGVHNIYIINRVDDTQTQLTQSVGNNVHAAFDPLGEKIVFRSNRTGAFEIFVMNIDGSDQQQLTFDGLSKRHPSFSPDGTEIIFQTVAKPGSSALAIVPPLGGDVTYLTSFAGAHLNPAWVSVSP